MEADTKSFNNLADQYQKTKRDTLLNILKCGELLDIARGSLSHGQWLNWLQDHRVAESVRTSQRLLAIYKDFGHLLSEEKQKSEALVHLGISHLLELKKLPDRFKKEIEVIKLEEGEEVKELKKVIDEEKLADFLDQPVETKSGTKVVRDLSLTELKKVINEATGVYEPEGSESSSQDLTKEIKMSPVLGGLDHLSNSIYALNPIIDELKLEYMTEEDRKEIKKAAKKSIEAVKGILLKLQALHEVI